MKLDDLVKKNEEINNEKNEIETLKKSLIEEFKKLKEVGREVGKLQEVKCKELRDKCMHEAEEFFKSGNFETECNEKTIIAKRDGVIINFKDDSQEDMMVFPIEIQPLKIYNAIEVRPCSEDQYMFYQKNNLEIKDKWLDFNNYIDQINKHNDKASLVNLIEKTKENIIHYENTIKNFEKIKYVYSLYQDYVEYGSFKEVFEKHVN